MSPSKSWIDEYGRCYKTKLHTILSCSMYSYTSSSMNCCDCVVLRNGNEVCDALKRPRFKCRLQLACIRFPNKSSWLRKHQNWFWKKKTDTSPESNVHTTEWLLLKPAKPPRKLPARPSKTIQIIKLLCQSTNEYRALVVVIFL